jgi:hypothetical protein
MNNEYVAILKRQTEILLKNVQATFDITTEQQFQFIIGQNRHLMYNLGMIHIMLQIETGKLPEYIGMSQPVMAQNKG